MLSRKLVIIYKATILKQVQLHIVLIIPKMT